MFTKAFLEKRGNGPLAEEEQLLQQQLNALGIPIEYYTIKQIQRRKLPLESQMFISGSMDAMHGAMKQLNIPVPAPNDYPASLRPFYQRKIWRSTIGQIEQQLRDGTGGPVFIKPAGRRKVFTGRVIYGYSDLYEITRISHREPVWCAEPVTWLSEYRVYVLAGKILKVSFYEGDDKQILDRASAQTCIDLYTASGTAPCAYAIDFGVLSTGATALIEANDGYSLGAYDIDAHRYSSILFQRWKELLMLQSKD